MPFRSWLTLLRGLSSGSGVATGLTAMADADGAAESVAEGDTSGEVDGPAWETWLDSSVGVGPATWLDPALPCPQPTTATPTSSTVAASLVVRLT